MERTHGRCADCHLPNRLCAGQENGIAPAFCSTTLYPQALAAAAEALQDPEVLRFAQMATIQEAAGYIDRHADTPYLHPMLTRVEELIQFCQRMGYKKLGLAFCGGLHKEAGILARILSDHGFTVVSSMCKVGGVDKSVIGISRDDQVRPALAHESMCNPIAQAEVLNAEATEFNIIVGLCVGHDSLFIRYSAAMVTVLIAKDRALAHNPAGALYTYNSYSQRLKSGSVHAPADTP